MTTDGTIGDGTILGYGAEALAGAEAGAGTIPGDGTVGTIGAGAVASVADGTTGAGVAAMVGAEALAGEVMVMHGVLHMVTELEILDMAEEIMPLITQDVDIIIETL